MLNGQIIERKDMIVHKYTTVLQRYFQCSGNIHHRRRLSWLQVFGKLLERESFPSGFAVLCRFARFLPPSVVSDSCRLITFQWNGAVTCTFMQWCRNDGVCSCRVFYCSRKQREKWRFQLSMCSRSSCVFTGMIWGELQKRRLFLLVSSAGTYRLSICYLSQQWSAKQSFICTQSAASDI